MTLFIVSRKSNQTKDNHRHTNLLATATYINTRQNNLSVGQDV